MLAHGLSLKRAVHRFGDFFARRKDILLPRDACGGAHPAVQATYSHSDVRRMSATILLLLQLLQKKEWLSQRLHRNMSCNASTLRRRSLIALTSTLTQLGPAFASSVGKRVRGAQQRSCLVSCNGRSLTPFSTHSGHGCTKGLAHDACECQHTGAKSGAPGWALWVARPRPAFSPLVIAESAHGAESIFKSTGNSQIASVYVLGCSACDEGHLTIVSLRLPTRRTARRSLGLHSTVVVMQKGRFGCY